MAHFESKARPPADGIDYRVDYDLDDEALNTLFAAAWPDYRRRSFRRILERSLGTVSAFDDNRLVGFVNLATDGGEHAFLLDPTVDARYHRRGIGTTLVQRAAVVARQRGCRWLHVDYEPALETFYRGAGFRTSAAGVMLLDSTT